jgi:2-haloacid dehalogenase
LEDVAQGLAEAMGFPLPAAERGFLAESVVDWPAFPDTAGALRVLAGRYRLAVLSNIDPELLAQSLPKLGVEFDRVITAADARSYKPGPGHFRLALEALDLPKERVLHVAQSLYHDIAPARSLGWSTVWVNRRAGRSGAGATYPAHAAPDLEVPDLATLAAMV